MQAAGMGVPTVGRQSADLHEGRSQLKSAFIATETLMKDEEVASQSRRRARGAFGATIATAPTLMSGSANA